MKPAKTPKGKLTAKSAKQAPQAAAQKEPELPPAPEPEPQRQPTRGDLKTGQSSRGSTSPIKRRKSRSHLQLHTPPEEKLRKIEQAINKRTAVHDLMYRQKQLEDAVREARRVNIMIEEEKQRMRQLKQKMVENNLAQYVVIARTEGKQWDYKRKSPNKKSFKDFHDAEVNGDGNQHDDDIPGLIPPIDERKKNGKLEPYKPPDVVFDDNYAFYMYYLNTSGQLVTPVEQMFQDNVQKQEQIRKLKEEKEKNSRVIKNQFSTLQANGNESNIDNSPANAKNGKPRFNNVKSKLGISSDNLPKTPGKTFLKKSQPSGDLIQSQKLKSSRGGDQSAKPQTRRDLIQTRQSVNRSSLSPKVAEPQQDQPPKKFTFLKRNVDKKVSPAPTTPALNNKRKVGQEQNENLRSKSTDQDQLRNSIAQSRLQTRQQASKTIESGENSPEPTRSPSPSKAKFTPKFDSKKKTLTNGSQSVNDLNAASRNGAPKILIKKSSTKEPDPDDDEEQVEQMPKKKGGLLNQAIARQSMNQKKSSSLLETQESSTLTLPPIGKSGIKPPSNFSSKVSSQVSRPPLPHIKSSVASGGTLQELFPSKIPQLKQQSSTSIQLISMNSESGLQLSTGRLSHRSSGGNQDIEKKKEQIQRSKEYSQKVKDQLKPKVDPKNQIEIELRRHSVSLNQLELQARQNPIKKVQLTDLL